MNDYETWPYKDMNGMNLDVGDLVKFWEGEEIYRIVIFTLYTNKAVIQSGSKQWTIPTHLLRWIR